jgi:hypothetical protein
MRNSPLPHPASRTRASDDRSSKRITRPRETGKAGEGGVPMRTLYLAPNNGSDDLMDPPKKSLLGCFR